MDRDGFRGYLVKGGRSTSAINRCLRYVSDFEDFLLLQKVGKNLENARSEDLVEFVIMLDSEQKSKSKGYLWAIWYYCDFTSNIELRDCSSKLREERIERKPFPLKDFLGVDPRYVQLLAKAGIKNVSQMLSAGGQKKNRENLANSTGIPESVILEFVKLSDLARIPGVKGVRARLYYDAGIDTVEKVADLEPEELREIVVSYIAQSGFDGIPTLPTEAIYTVEKARVLPLIIED